MAAVKDAKRTETLPTGSTPDITNWPIGRDKWLI